MKPFLRLASVLMIAASASLVAACDNKAPEQTETTAAPAEGASAAATGAFDVNGVALSTASLGDFPYLRLPEGYKPQNSETQDFADFPFWTGSRFEMVEGAFIRPRSPTTAARASRGWSCCGTWSTR